MIKKISIAITSLLIGFPLISLADNPDFSKINFKKTFCANQEYLGNAASKRPHLHCSTSFMSYKKSNGDHSVITEMGNCTRTNAVFDEIKSNKQAYEYYQELYNVLVLYHQAGCPK